MDPQKEEVVSPMASLVCGVLRVLFHSKSQLVQLRVLMIQFLNISSLRRRLRMKTGITYSLEKQFFFK